MVARKAQTMSRNEARKGKKTWAPVFDDDDDALRHLDTHKKEGPFLVTWSSNGLSVPRFRSCSSSFHSVQKEGRQRWNRHILRLSPSLYPVITFSFTAGVVRRKREEERKQGDSAQ